MSDPARITARAFYRVWNDDVAVFLAGWGDRGGPTHAGRSVQFESREPGMHEPEPTFSMSLEDAQALMGSLWDAGIRPAQAKAGDGQAKHLEDMRALVFAKLGVEKPC